jgi:hypothetical protein
MTVASGPSFSGVRWPGARSPVSRVWDSESARSRAGMRQAVREFGDLLSSFAGWCLILLAGLAVWIGGMYWFLRLLTGGFI